MHWAFLFSYMIYFYFYVLNLAAKILPFNDLADENQEEKNNYLPHF